MAKEIPIYDQPVAPAPPEAPKEQPAFSPKKLIIFGVPVFLIQFVMVYFLTVKFIAPANTSHDAPSGEEKKASGEKGLEEEHQVFLLKEVLVNPAGTNGTRFLLTSIGFEVSSPEAKQDLEKKEVQVRDIMNTILTNKTLPELVDFQKREIIRTEIAQKTSKLLKDGTLRKVYFSKFIIQ